MRHEMKIDVELILTIGRIYTEIRNSKSVARNNYLENKFGKQRNNE